MPNYFSNEASTSPSVQPLNPCLGPERKTYVLQQGLELREFNKLVMIWPLCQDLTILRLTKGFQWKEKSGVRPGFKFWYIYSFV